MGSRREFLKTTAAAAVVSRRVLGANDRIRMALIGTGGRGMNVCSYFRRYADCEFVAACDVFKSRLDAAIKTLPGKVESYGDYRKILDRKDIDALLVATPDHWHSPIVVDGCAAGKDAYVEKPVSNTVEAGQKLVEATRRYNRVVQVGAQQRSTPHYQEACKLVQDGYIGKVNHCVLYQRGTQSQVMQPTQAPPPDLDWEMFQGPAPRRAYSPSRLRWRSFYAYGGGVVTDMGVHWGDVALMCMKADSKAPLLTHAIGQYVHFPRDLDQVPDTFSCSWQYDDFVMSFTNTAPPGTQSDAQGNWFYGQKGVLQLTRDGYWVYPVMERAIPRAGGPPAPTPIETRSVVDKVDYSNDAMTNAHVRNFLDCVKSRRRPAMDAEIGFNSTLPCLIALLALQEGRAFVWDGKSARAV